MITAFASVIFGLLLLVGGGELLLRGAVRLATLAQVTPAVIGLTVVAAGTSVPELAVSLLAALRGNEAVAIGNIVGSNIFNIAFILGLAAIIRPLIISGNTIRLEYPVLLLVTILFLIVSRDGSIGRINAIFFLATYIGFTTYLVKHVRKQMTKEEVTEYRAEVVEFSSHDGNLRNVEVRSSLLLTAGGIALLIGGAQATVSGAVELGRFWEMSESMIGLTIVAAGTGLPEVVTSLVSSARGRDDVAIGNIIGSNLFNILGILGITALLRPVAVSLDIISHDNWWMLGITILLLPLMMTGRQLERREGAGLLAVYVIYLGLLIRRSASG